MTDTAIKIFSITDSEWWMGTDLASVVKAAQEEYGLDDDDTANAAELAEADFDALRFADSDENDQLTGTTRTFREQLAIEIGVGGQLPRLFAMEEF